MTATPEPIVQTHRITSTHLTEPQLQRAWALGYVRLCWPTILPDTAQSLAAWITNGMQP